MKQTTLKVLTFNIHKGFSTGNVNFVLEETRSAIHKVHADLVFLQEVVGFHGKHRRKYLNWPKTSQFEYLADTLWPHFAYGKNAVHMSGHHGNAILSKFPIVDWENINISTNRFERRGLLHAVIKTPNHSRLHAICIHLDLLESGRKKQIEFLAKRIDDSVPEKEPLIIAGDFNDWKERVTTSLQRKLQAQEVFQKLRGRHPNTFPSWFPILSLDRIYYRDLKAKSARALQAKSWRTLSDHTPLYAEFQI